MAERFVAVKSRTRAYGYAVQDTTGKAAWVAGPGHTFGWYKRKADAQKRADVHNGADGRI
jgi:hypothetical protein